MGSKPNAVEIGKRTGVIITIAAILSKKQPTISKTMLINSKIRNLFFVIPKIAAAIACGTLPTVRAQPNNYAVQTRSIIPLEV